MDDLSDRTEDISNVGRIGPLLYWKELQGNPKHPGRIRETLATKAQMLVHVSIPNTPSAGIPPDIVLMIMGLLSGWRDIEFCYGLFSNGRHWSLSDTGVGPVSETIFYQKRCFQLRTKLIGAGFILTSMRYYTSQMDGRVGSVWCWVLSRLRIYFSGWCIDQGDLTANPSYGTSAKKKKKKDVWL